MKQHQKNKVIIMAIFCVLLTSALSQAQLITPQENIPEFRQPYTISFSENDFIFASQDGYDIVWLQEGDNSNEIGKPAMPVKNIVVALPSGIEVQQVNLVDVKSVDIQGEFTIFPAQPAKRTNGLDDNDPFVEPNENIYTSNVPYPSTVVEFIDQTDLAGQGLANIQINPLQYTPNDKKLILHTEITFVIQGREGYICGDYLSPALSESGKETYVKMMKERVINPDDVNLQSNPLGDPLSLSIPPGGPYDHVIITSSTQEQYWTPLVEWHTKRGLRDTVVTTDYIYDNYAGSDNPQKIQNFIADAYSNWATRYVLLAGEHNTVPFKFVTYFSESTPSDQYYSDFDNDWSHEVAVGRATAEYSSQVNLFIDKVLQYEKDPPLEDYPLDVLLIGMDLDSYTHAEQLKNYIAAFLPGQFEVTKVYDSDGSGHLIDTINALNDGQNLVNHADHGSWEFMGTGYTNHGWGLYNYHIDALHNDDKLSVVVSLACHANRMDYYQDCIAEHFVVYNANQAGVAFNGNTRNGIYYQGQPYELSNELDLEWWKGLFLRDYVILGETIIDSKGRFYTGNENIRKHCEWTFNLLGEPAMPIWTDTPQDLTVSSPATLPLGSSTYDVHVEDGNGDVEDAYVCLWKGDEVYLTEYTDSQGDVSFTPEPTTEGIMYVTVTKHNYIPNEGEALVTGGIPGDANADGVVDIDDLFFVLGHWGETGGPADVNEDGTVDIDDIFFVLAHWT